MKAAMNPEKPFRLALLVGRFQMLHLGHEDMIGKALGAADEVGILIGSSNEEGTYQNPFSFEVRREILKKIYGDRVRIAPLEDIHVGNVPRWGEYVLEEAEKAFGALPDLFVTGKEPRRVSWFDGPRGEGIAELEIPKTVEISASELREMLIRGDEENWKKFTDPAIHAEFERLRTLVLKAQNNRVTGSI